jgi:poly-beta-1,6-N-acetyl-D-glucosamine biosynthesis protein PgaD
MTMPAWPPLIRADRVPAWVRVRDLVLTVAAWAALLYWVRGALLLIADWLWYPFFELNAQPAPDWPRIWSTLAPFVVLAAVLAAWLVYWSLRRRKILVRQRSMAQPPALDLGVHANRYGLGPSDIAALRDARVVTVQFDADGAICPPAPPQTAAALIK